MTAARQAEELARACHGVGGTQWTALDREQERQEAYEAALWHLGALLLVLAVAFALGSAVASLERVVERADACDASASEESKP